ncbi:ribonuclease E activity regulator RraA [Nitratireductor sp. CH_MIT9313-5]|jgi:regulator of ribonuclease activity A|uniref:ribonuclease E activity regulator RraA n=1 Tax=Nitratireductor sp. CH_MIT9313-5 TaxID=3107764 RepID=UPI003008A78E
MKTADLIDSHAKDLSLVHLPWRSFGKRQSFAAPIQTVKCFEDNSEVRAQLETPGKGRVLAIDGGGSTRIALLGDILVNLAMQNDWRGIVLNGALRDSAEIEDMDILVFALGTSPVKSAKEGWGKSGCEMSFGDVNFSPGDWLYADGDGVLHSSKKLI